MFELILRARWSIPESQEGRRMVRSATGELLSHLGLDVCEGMLLAMLTCRGAAQSFERSQLRVGREGKATLGGLGP